MIQVVSNILVESLPSFKVFENIYPSHFEHIYSKEEINCGISLFNGFVESSIALLLVFFQELNSFRFVIQLNWFCTVKHDVYSKQAYSKVKTYFFISGLKQR